MIPRGKSMTELVRHIVSESDSSEITLKKRIKLTRIFNQIEEKALDQLMKYIEESTSRYKGMRSGCNIKAMVSKAKGINALSFNKISLDEFYSTFNLDEERDYLKRKHLIQMEKRKEFKKVLALCSESHSKDKSLKNKALKIKLPTEKNNKAAINKNQPIICSEMNSCSIEGGFGRNIKVSKPDLFTHSSLVNDVITKDMLNIEEQLLRYIRELRSIKREEQPSTNVQSKIMQTSLSLANLQLLTYTRKPNEPPIKQEPLPKHDISLHNIFKYAKHGLNATDISLINKARKESSQAKTERQADPLAFNPYKNTVALVKNEAKKGLIIDIIFAKKLAAFEHSLTKIGNYKNMKVTGKKSRLANMNTMSNKDVLKGKGLVKKFINPIFITKA